MPDEASYDYVRAIIEENVLGKRTMATRRESLRRLSELYALNPGLSPFRALRDLWQANPEAQPLLAFLCASARDPILRASGTLSSGAQSFRMAVLGILLQASDLPAHYGPGTFMLWLRRKEYEDAIRAALAAQGLDRDREATDLYVSPPIGEALLALESRPRVKEQQKRIGSAEFRNTHFSYQMNDDGVDRYVATPELQSDDAISPDPLPPGQVWAIGPGGADDGAELYRIEVASTPGSGVRMLNVSAPGTMRESVKAAEQNLYTQARVLVGDREPRHHELTIQVRALDTARSGTALGVPILIALSSALLEKSIRGGVVIVGGLNLGGGIEPVYNAVDVVEIAVEKGAEAIFMPVSARRQLNDLSDDVATKIAVQYYGEAREALGKALLE